MLSAKELVVVGSPMEAEAMNSTGASSAGTSGSEPNTGTTVILSARRRIGFPPSTLALTGTDTIWPADPTIESAA